MFIITKTFTDDEGHLYTKVNPKQYSTPEEAYDAMREDYLNELKSRGLDDNGGSNDDGESCPGGWGFQSRRVITTRTTSPPLMCQSSLSASITLF